MKSMMKSIAPSIQAIGKKLGNSKPESNEVVKKKKQMFSAPSRKMLGGMKSIAIFLILSLSFPVSLAAQQNTTRFFLAYDYANLTVDTTVGGVGFAAADIDGSKAQLVTFTVTCASGTDCPIRVTSDGTAPTTSVGMRLSSGQAVSIYGNGNITRFRAIQEGATGAVLNTQFYQ